MAGKESLTASHLRRLLHYDKKTGVFLWRWRVPDKRGWNARHAGTIAGTVNGKTGRRMIRIQSYIYLASRLAWLYVHGEWPPADLDHKDRIRDHNWIDNLRPASRSQNQQNRNRPSHNRSGVLGVCWDSKRGKWLAQIKVSGRSINLGCFTDKNAAIAARAAAANAFFGEFVGQEFPDIV